MRVAGNPRDYWLFGNTCGQAARTHGGTATNATADISRKIDWGR
jgi:hypothetical protein